MTQHGPMIKQHYHIDNTGNKKKLIIKCTPHKSNLVIAY